MKIDFREYCESPSVQFPKNMVYCCIFRAMPHKDCAVLPQEKLRDSFP